MLNKLMTDKAYNLMRDYFVKVFLLVIGLIILAEGVQYGSKVYAVLGAIMFVAGVFTKKGAFKNDL